MVYIGPGQPFAARAQQDQRPAFPVSCRVRRGSTELSLAHKSSLMFDETITTKKAGNLKSKIKNGGLTFFSILYI